MATFPFNDILALLMICGERRADVSQRFFRLDRGPRRRSNPGNRSRSFVWLGRSHAAGKTRGSIRLASHAGAVIQINHLNGPASRTVTERLFNV
jgi:hypothetical protein